MEIRNFGSIRINIHLIMFDENYFNTATTSCSNTISVEFIENRATTMVSFIEIFFLNETHLCLMTSSGDLRTQTHFPNNFSFFQFILINFSKCNIEIHNKSGETISFH